MASARSKPRPGASRRRLELPSKRGPPFSLPSAPSALSSRRDRRAERASRASSSSRFSSARAGSTSSGWSMAPSLSCCARSAIRRSIRPRPRSACRGHPTRPRRSAPERRHRSLSVHLCLSSAVRHGIMGEAMTDHPRIQVRRLIEADAPLFREIRLEALRLSPEAFGSSFEQESERSLGQFEETLRMSDVFGAFRDADLVGMAGYRAQAGAKQAHKGYLWGMYVRPAARGTGVGRQLVEAVLGHARERVELVQLTVVSENQTAQQLYRRLGFVAYGHEIHSLKQGGRYYDEVLDISLHDQFAPRGPAGLARQAPRGGTRARPADRRSAPPSDRSAGKRMLPAAGPSQGHRRGRAQ